MVLQSLNSSKLFMFAPQRFLETFNKQLLGTVLSTHCLLPPGWYGRAPICSVKALYQFTSQSLLRSSRCKILVYLEWSLSRPGAVTWEFTSMLAAPLFLLKRSNLIGGPFALEMQIHNPRRAAGVLPRGPTYPTIPEVGLAPRPSNIKD